jgi:4-amino-4-deoxy-L-arabinose transferase-like glycosyltransferase
MFALCAAIYLLPFMRLVFIGSDEGTLVDGAVRILHGQVFARDFFEVMGPGTFYILAAMFKLFGATFLAARLWLFVTSLGTFLAIYFLACRVCPRYQLLPPILLVGVYFSTFWPMVNHHVDSNFFALLSVICMVLWKDLRKSGLLLAAGVLCGVTTCILQPKGLLLLLAILVWLWVQLHRRSAWLSAIGLVAAGYVSVVGGTLLYFWSRGALWDLIYMNFVWPSHNYGTVNTIPYATGMHQFWSHWAGPIHNPLLSTPVAVVLIVPFLLVAALPALVIALGILRGKDNLRPEILLYWLCGWALWLSEIHRLDIAHLTSGSLLFVILCIHFLVAYRGKIADWFLQILAISAGALVTVNLLIVLSAQSVPIRVGAVGMFKPDPAIAFLDTHAAAGSEIFAYPTCPMYYFLSGTTNPTRYSLLLYNYNTPSQFQDTIRVLDQHRVKYVIWDTTVESKAAPYFSAAMYRPAGGLLMEPYLEAHYRIVKDFDGVLILERKEDGHANRR